jgi:hypothetical protein
MFNLSNDRRNITILFDKAKFDKKSYKLYTSILNKKKNLTNYLFVFLIFQASQQLDFYGTFHDLYYDVIKRRTFYIKHININMKKSYLCSENIFIVILKKIFGFDKSERETEFNDLISAFDFDKKIDDIFVGDDNEKLEKFITICGQIRIQKSYENRLDRIIPID